MKKTFSRVRSNSGCPPKAGRILLFALSLHALCTSAHAAPLAILADVAGTVQIVRGGKVLAAKSGAKLNAGDRVVSRGGKATIFYLGRAPQKLSANASVGIGAGAAAKKSGVWRVVYNGVNNGFETRTRVVAAVRDRDVELWTPVNCKTVGRPRFIWTDSAAPNKAKYEIVVRAAASSVGASSTAKNGAAANSTVLWRATVAATRAQYPANAPALKAGAKYFWSVARAGSEKKSESTFQIATAAEAASLREATALFTSLDGATRRTASATFADSAGFSGEALQFLGLNFAPVSRANFASLDESGARLLRAIAARNGQGALLRTAFPVHEEKNVDANPRLATPDADLPLDAKFAAIPASARKRFTDEKNAFALDIPRSWGAWNMEIGGVSMTQIGAQYNDIREIDVLVATQKNLFDTLMKLLEANQSAPKISATADAVFEGAGFTAKARRTDFIWRDQLGGKNRDEAREWRANAWEFARDGKTFVVVVGAEKADFDRTLSLAAPLLKSFSTAPKAQTERGISEPKMEDLMAEMTRINADKKEMLQRLKIEADKLDFARDENAPAARNAFETAWATEAAARQADDAAWAAWSQGARETAGARALPLWTQADTLRRDAIGQKTQIYETEFAATQKRIAELRAQTPRISVASSYELILNGWLDTQCGRAQQLQLLARSTGDNAAKEKWARVQFDARREQLEMLPFSLNDRAATDAKTGATNDGDVTVSRRLQLAIALEWLGDARLARADFPLANALYNQSLQWRRALPATSSRSIQNILRSIAWLHVNSGDRARAREGFAASIAEIDCTQQAVLAQATRIGGAPLAAIVRSDLVQTRWLGWNNLAYIAQDAGDLRAARADYQKALQAWDEIADADALFKPLARAKTLANLAALETTAGDLDAALKISDQAHALLLAAHSESDLALWLINRAGLLELRGDREGARRMAFDARTRHIALHDNVRATFASSFLSRLAREDKDWPNALIYAREALDLSRASGDGDAQASAARGMAFLIALAENARPDAAIWARFDAYIAQSLAHEEKLGSAFGIASTLDKRAQGREKRGDNAGAEADYRAAIARLEAVRATVNSSELFSDQKANYEIYERFVRLLLRTEKPEEAFDFLQRARSSKLRENLRLSSLKSPDPALQKLLDRASSLEKKLGTLREQLQAEAALPQTDKVKVENLKGLIAATQAEFFRVSSELKAKNPAFSRALTVSPQELKKAQRALPADTILVQYAPLGDQLYIFAVTRDSLKIFAPEVRSPDVLAQVRRFRELMDNAKKAVQRGAALPKPEDDAALRANLTKLYALLIAPIAGEIAAKNTVAFVPSGALYYLPLHALAHETPGGLKFLAEEKRVAYLAAADVLSVVQTRDETQFGAGALALGDPTGSDLPEARDEVRAISQIFPASISYVGDNARKAILLDAKNLDRRVLHLAAHGVLDSARPDSSYIQLSGKGETGRLAMGEIVGLDLNRVDLVTLSACQTAIGTKDPDGGEISSLAQSFSSAGASSVVASLWSVEDNSTRLWMEMFYKSLAAGKSKAQAAQDAQIALLNDPKTRHPFFWAPFELLGDWR